MNKYILPCFVILLFLLVACQQSKTNTQNTQVQNCDDSNQCTNDILSADGKCSYTGIKPCCGNNVTSCINDCGACEADVKIYDTGCVGECTVAVDSFRIKGDSTISFDVENLGEDSALLNSDLVCSRQGYSGKANTGYYGFTSSSSFENAQNSMLVNGKSKVKYNFALTGKTSTTGNLECNLYLKSSSGLSSFVKQFFVRFE